GILLLIGGIIIGSLIGALFPESVQWFKPLGDIFLNMIFAAVIPLIFFAISSSVANIDQSQKIGRILAVMASVFLTIIITTAIITIVAIWLFPVKQEIV